MSFIGVIAKSKNAQYISKFLQENLDKKVCKVIVINNNSIENMKNVKFETILITENNEEIIQNRELLKNIIKNTRNIVINTDVDNSLELIENIKLSVITYGFNSKATITASSVANDDILICLQRKMNNIYGEEIEPQEINVNLEAIKITNNSHIIMGIVAVFLLYNKNI